MPTRREKWQNTSDRFILDVRNGDANPALVAALESCPDKADDGGVFWRLGGARELILHYENDETYRLEAINFALDARTGELVLGPGWSAIELSRDELQRQLAYSTIYSVPVYPNDEEAGRHLQAVFADLIANGVEFELEGKKTQLVWERGDAITFGDDSSVAISPTESFFPADALVLTAELERQHAAVSQAVRTLAELKRATDRLEGLLTMSVRDEAALQLCLKEHPVLFGLEYSEIIPKFKLGKTFEMDFALQRHSGLVDLLEIEPSNLPLYTKAGNPTQHLVHAEQQVLDWLEWLETNARLARDDLPGLTRPIALVCIGSRASLSDADSIRLRRRNSTWNGTITILTYDDLLDRARNVLLALTRTQAAIAGE